METTTYIIIINILTFIIFSLDKFLAVKHKYRISEAKLFFFSIIGGSFGALLAMYFMHHKTRKRKFTVGIPIIMIIQILLYGQFTSIM